jgi:hypothetical protein
MHSLVRVRSVLYDKLKQALNKIIRVNGTVSGVEKARVLRAFESRAFEGGGLRGDTHTFRLDCWAAIGLPFPSWKSGAYAADPLPTSLDQQVQPKKPSPLLRRITHFLVVGAVFLVIRFLLLTIRFSLL